MYSVLCVAASRAAGCRLAATARARRPGAWRAAPTASARCSTRTSPGCSRIASRVAPARSAGRGDTGQVAEDAVAAGREELVHVDVVRAVWLSREQLAFDTVAATRREAGPFSGAMMRSSSNDRYRNWFDSLRITDAHVFGRALAGKSLDRHCGDDEHGDDDAGRQPPRRRKQQRHQHRASAEQPVLGSSATASPQRSSAIAFHACDRATAGMKNAAAHARRSRHGARRTSGTSCHHEQHLIRRPNEHERTHAQADEARTRSDGRCNARVSSTRPAREGGGEERVACELVEQDSVAREDEQQRARQQSRRASRTSARPAPHARIEQRVQQREKDLRRPAADSSGTPTPRADSGPRVLSTAG